MRSVRAGWRWIGSCKSGNGTNRCKKALAGANASETKAHLFKKTGGCGGSSMYDLNDSDYALISLAQNTIQMNYDDENYNHTVGAAVRCKSGKIYVGVNVYSLHGACAEQIAIGTAITNGERAFETIVAVRGKRGEEIIPPCGNCRQLLCDYAPMCEVIIVVNGKTKKVCAKELQPFAYCLEK